MISRGVAELSLWEWASLPHRPLVPVPSLTEVPCVLTKGHARDPLHRARSHSSVSPPDAEAPPLRPSSHDCTITLDVTRRGQRPADLAPART